MTAITCCHALFHAEIAIRLDRPHPETAVESAIESVTPRAQEITGPSVQGHTINEVGLALRGFARVLAARIIGVTDGAVAVPVVDAVLAPDRALADMDALLFGQIAQVLGGQETGHQALGFVAVANHVADFQQRFPDVQVDLFSGAIHRREISTRNESDLVAVGLVIADNLFADGGVIRAFIMERKP